MDSPVPNWDALLITIAKCWEWYETVYDDFSYFSQLEQLYDSF